MENISLYTDKYDEEFEPHLRPFTQGVWGLLMKVSTMCTHTLTPTRPATCRKYICVPHPSKRALAACFFLHTFRALGVSWTTSFANARVR